MPDTDIERALTRARKLIQMQESRGATEAEAQIAAAKLQDLLIEFNLTLAQVGSDESRDSSSATRSKLQTDLVAMYEYQQQLMGTIAANNFCLHRVVDIRTDEYNYKPKGRRHVLVGLKVNVDVTLMTYDYLHATLLRLVKEAGYTGQRDRNYFLEGAVSRLSERLRSLRRDSESASRTAATANGSGKELVCLEDLYGTEADLNNDVLNSYPMGTTAQRRRDQERLHKDQEAKYNRFVAAGVEAQVARYMSWGYSPEDAVSYGMNTRPARGRGGRRTSWTREDRQYARKVGSRAYQDGRAAGDGVGLDPQVNEQRRRRIG
jgi:hypothetical protein